MMLNWLTDMSLAPRPGYGEGVQWVLLAFKDTDKMVASYWLPQDKTNREGHWFNVAPGDEPEMYALIDPPTKKPVVVGLPAGMVL